MDAVAPSPTTAPVAGGERQRWPWPTFLGWRVLIEGVGLALLMLWLPRPLAASLGIGLLAALAVSAWWAPRRLRCVRAEWVLPLHPHADDEVAVAVKLSADGGAPPFAIETVMPGQTSAQAVGHSAGLGRVPARVGWSVRFPHRGRHRLAALVAATDQPFGLLHVTRSVAPASEVLVLPALGTLRRELRNRLTEWTEEIATGDDRGDDELAHLRPYRPGDARHSIHWRASARARHLLVAERQTPASRHLALVVDTRAATGKRLERLVCIAATLVDHLAAHGWHLSLHGQFAPAGVQGTRTQLLEVLAEVQTGPVEDLARFVPTGGSVLILASHAIELPARVPRPLLLLLNECEELVRLPGKLR